MEESLLISKALREWLCALGGADAGEPGSLSAESIVRALLEVAGAMRAAGEFEAARETLDFALAAGTSTKPHDWGVWRACAAALAGHGDYHGSRDMVMAYVADVEGHQDPALCRVALLLAIACEMRRGEALDEARMALDEADASLGVLEPAKRIAMLIEIATERHALGEREVATLQLDVCRQSVWQSLHDASAVHASWKQRFDAQRLGGRLGVAFARTGRSADAIEAAYATLGTNRLMEPDVGVRHIVVALVEADAAGHGPLTDKLIGVSRRAEGPNRPFDVLMPIAASLAKKGHFEASAAMLNPYGDPGRLAGESPGMEFRVALLEWQIALGAWSKARACVCMAGDLECPEVAHILGNALMREGRRSDAAMMLSELIERSRDLRWLLDLTRVAVALAAGDVSVLRAARDAVLTVTAADR